MGTNGHRFVMLGVLGNYSIACGKKKCQFQSVNIINRYLVRLNTDEYWSQALVLYACEC